jgi:hypothetical protein
MKFESVATKLWRLVQKKEQWFLRFSKICERVHNELVW